MRGRADRWGVRQIPGMILAFLQALFACVLYLDRRFDLHQRLAVMLGAFLEGLVEIEREVGVMRNVGEALSIGWYVLPSLFPSVPCAC